MLLMMMIVESKQSNENENDDTLNSLVRARGPDLEEPGQDIDPKRNTVVWSRKDATKILCYLMILPRTQWCVRTLCLKMRISVS